MKKLLPVALLLLCLSLRASAGIMEADAPAPTPTPTPTPEASPQARQPAEESDNPTLYEWLLSLLS